MSIKNEKGQVVIFLCLLAPFFVCLLVVATEFSRLVATKIKLQGSLDRGVFKGAEYLTFVLNQTAKANRQAHEIFLETRKKFRQDSRPSIQTAKNLIQEAWREQDTIRDEKIIPLAEEAYQKAYQIVEQEVQKDFPEAKILSFYRRPVEILNGRLEELPFDRIKGIFMDPKGHRKVPKIDFKARVAFVKKTGPREKTALAAGAEVPIPPSLLSFLTPPRPMRSVAAAQPHGGSVWSYALTKDDTHLYQTTFVPLKTLPPNGYFNFWEDASPYEMEH